MSYPLTPDSPSYQEIALRVAVRDVLSAFDPTYTTGLRSTLSILRPSVEALRIAHDDLIHAPYQLRIPVSSFLSAYDFTLATSRYAAPEDYFEGARQRLYAIFAAPDKALVTSQEETLCASVSDFLSAWANARDTAAPSRADFPNLPSLPTNRLHRAFTRSRQESQAFRRLDQADKSLHLAYEHFTFAPVHLRLALSHFLMSWDLLKAYDDLALDRARKSLQRAFDPATKPAPSVYRAPKAPEVALAL